MSLQGEIAINVHNERLIKKYKDRIKALQKKQKIFEVKGMGGACLSLQGEIQAYNAVISDLKQLII